MEPVRSTVDGELAQELQARGQRVTSQRLVIHRVVRERETHMTAEQIHHRTRAALPGVSLPTVYATLELLAELRLVRRIDVGTGTLLYDGRREPHHHAVCRSCGRVWDLFAQPDLEAVTADARAQGLSVEVTQVLVTGTCRSC